jgi:ElaB/YqjD/DUF883 family membrane-anchored ribosome-binding protein
MRYPDARNQLDAAVSNVESALKNLSDRLEDVLPGNSHRRRISRARRAITRTASSVAERVPGQASSLVEDTRRTVREHPVRVALTAAIAGYFVWSLIRVANEKSENRGYGRSLADRYRTSQDEGVLRPH